MSLMKWATPFEELDLFRKEMDALLSNSQAAPGTDFNPPVEVIETDSHYQVHLILPGLPTENLSEHVHLDATPKTLTLSGELRQRELGPNEKRLINQFRSGKFFKQLSFPDGIDHENIQASYRNGILEVTLPKAVAAQKRSIQIQIQ